MKVSNNTQVSKFACRQVFKSRFTALTFIVEELCAVIRIAKCSPRERFMAFSGGKRSVDLASVIRKAYLTSGNARLHIIFKTHQHQFFNFRITFTQPQHWKWIPSPACVLHMVFCGLAYCAPFKNKRNLFGISNNIKKIKIQFVASTGIIILENFSFDVYVSIFFNVQSMFIRLTDEMSKVSARTRKDESSFYCICQVCCASW